MTTLQCRNKISHVPAWLLSPGIANLESRTFSNTVYAQRRSMGKWELAPDVGSSPREAPAFTAQGMELAWRGFRL